MSRRQMLLLETLGVKMSFLEPVPSHLQLPVAVTCYWVRCSEPKVKLHQLKALLLMIVSGELHRITNDLGMCPKNTVQVFSCYENLAQNCIFLIYGRSSKFR